MYRWIRIQSNLCFALLNKQSLHLCTYCVFRVSWHHWIARLYVILYFFCFLYLLAGLVCDMEFKNTVHVFDFDLHYLYHRKFIVLSHFNWLIFPSWLKLIQSVFFFASLSSSCDCDELISLISGTRNNYKLTILIKLF